MHIGQIRGRAALVVDDRALDIATASDGAFPSSVDDLYSRWSELTLWASNCPLGSAQPFNIEDLGAPVRFPRQIIAFGLNYRDHAAEAGFGVPDGLPPVFTKFASAITGPNSTVALPQGNVDWEVELAVVIGASARHITPAQAWDHVAGVTVAQDISERVLQMSGPAPQFSLGKSHPGFLPLGPTLVTPDELPDRDALDLRTTLNGETVQAGNTRDLIVPVAEGIARLSDILELFPGDLILTGTPAGVGMGRTPQRFLAPGDELISAITGVGPIHQHLVASDR
ncbi:fumarylacetoacetate hydrolase family protein [Actinomycetospora sp. OC33-EN08]|uniref:Fumarylacetoacetate hydrolase family protein n=1 Tax=Actinomycetospora aurantiaca TaxID=3129233 RepID=A0ABU8MNM4_9PSEU